MVDRHALSSRFDALASYVTELRALGTLPRERFLEEPAVHHLAERYLHLSCEAVLDIAQHLIADLGFRQPQSNREAIQVLAEEGVLDAHLAARLQGWMGFRNVLVHLYLAVDHARSYEVIQNELGDLDAFVQKTSVYLEG